MVCIRFISVPFSVVCLVDGYDYTRSTNIAQVGLRKPLETLGFIGVSRNAYRAHVRPIGGTCQAWHARAKRDVVGVWHAVGAWRVDQASVTCGRARAARAARTWYAVRAS